MLPAALSRLSFYSLLIFVPIAACAQSAAPWPVEPPDAADEASFGVPAVPFAAPPMRGVRRLSDSELACSQIYAETRALETTIERQQALATQAQQAMAETQTAMTQQASSLRGGGMGSAIGSGLLGMIPGAGQIQGYAMQAAAEARRSQMQESMQKMVQAQQQLVQLEQAVEHAQARHEHLADLFLKKGCKLSQVQATAP